MDFSRVDFINEFRLSIAARLWCEIDDLNAPHSVSEIAIYNHLVESIKRRDLAAEIHYRRGTKLQPFEEVEWKRPVWSETKVLRKNLVKFAKKIGEKPKFLFPDERDKQSNVRPAFTYPNRKLEHLYAAIENFWLDYENRERRPTKDEILDWLLKERKVGSENLAKAIDLIIRPDDVKGGHV